MGRRGVYVWDRLTGLAGLLLIISLWLDWYSSNGDADTGWQTQSVVDVIIFVVGAIAVALPFVARIRQTPADAQRYVVIVAAAALVAVAILVYRVASPPKLNALKLGTSVLGGAWVALALAIAVLVFALAAMRSRAGTRVAG